MRNKTNLFFLKLSSFSKRNTEYVSLMFHKTKIPTFWPTATVTTWGLKGHILTSVREEQLQVMRTPFPGPIGTLSDHISSI